MSGNDSELFEFSDFRLDVAERLLIQRGERLPLAEKAFETLCVLVRESGHLVTKEDLLKKVWPDTIVEENSLDKSVSLLRNVLGERSGKEKFIETVRGRGYRFVAPVRSVKPSKEENVRPRLVSPEISWRRIGLILTAAIIAVSFVLFLLRSPRVTEAQYSLNKIDSLAVLPLKNLSADPDEEYFADAMTEELITKLASIAGVRVISSTSVMEYKDRKKPLKQIGKELNVDAILEGSVLQAGEHVRITVQLIHAAMDSHLWAESYERDFENVLVLQNEVATAIAREVHVALTPDVAARFKNAPRVNPRAYQAYLRGLYYLERDISEENLRLALHMFQTAVNLDQTFASAYAQVSSAESFLYFTFDRSPERLVRSKAAVDRVFALDPGSGDGHVALASYYYRGFRDYDRALEELRIAQRSLPNNKTILAMQGTIYRRQGKWDEAAAMQERLVTLDPRHSALMSDIGYTYSMMRRYAQAQNYFDLSISLAPDEQNAYIGKALNQVRWTGDTTLARNILQQAPYTRSSLDLIDKFWIEFQDRNFDAALGLLSSPYMNVPGKDVYFGLTYRMLHQTALASASFQNAVEYLRKEIEKTPDNDLLYSLLGIAYAGLGRKKEAISSGKRAMELLPISTDALWGTYPVVRMAWIYGMLGEPDAAIEQIEKLLSIPSSISVAQLRIDPMWDPLRNHSKFGQILNQQ